MKEQVYNYYFLQISSVLREVGEKGDFGEQPTIRSSKTRDKPNGNSRGKISRLVEKKLTSLLVSQCFCGFRS